VRILFKASQTSLRCDTGKVRIRRCVRRRDAATHSALARPGSWCVSRTLSKRGSVASDQPPKRSGRCCFDLTRRRGSWCKSRGSGSTRRSATHGQRFRFRCLPDGDRTRDINRKRKSLPASRAGCCKTSESDRMPTLRPQTRIGAALARHSRELRPAFGDTGAPNRRLRGIAFVCEPTRRGRVLCHRRRWPGARLVGRSRQRDSGGDERDPRSGPRPVSGAGSLKARRDEHGER